MRTIDVLAHQIAHAHSLTGTRAQFVSIDDDLDDESGSTVMMTMAMLLMGKHLYLYLTE